MARTATSFGGAITTTGHSGALRLEKSFFQAHPEFRLKAKLRVHHIGPGQLLVSVDDGPKRPQRRKRMIPSCRPTLRSWKRTWR